MAECAVEGCDKPSKTPGQKHCLMHYTRFYRYGTYDLVPLQRTTTPSYRRVHKHLQADRGRASEHPCAECGAPADQWSYDHADPNERMSKQGPYSTDQNHYQPRCYSCHIRMDKGRKAS